MFAEVVYEVLDGWFPVFWWVGPVTKSDANNEELENERDRVLERLTGTAPTPQAGQELPASAGIYAIWIIEPAALETLGLEDKPGEAPLQSRPLYIGKATDSIRRRLNKHFETGDTGHSSLRRTIAALLDLDSRPRRTKIQNPTEDQLKTMISNFDLTEPADQKLSDWMHENLLVSSVSSTSTRLGAIEKEIARVLRPPLDQRHMWVPNPWHQQVADARGRLREEARQLLDEMDSDEPVDDPRSAFETLKKVGSLGELRGSVFSDAVEFAWPIPESDWVERLPDFDPSNPQESLQENARRVGVPLLEEVESDLSEGEVVEVQSIGYGRGFEVEGIALIIFSVLGAIATLEGNISFFKRVQSWYRKLLSTDLPDGTHLPRPTLSLGAAKALAGAHLWDHLEDRVGERADIRLITAVVHPVGNEIDHSGVDLFTIVFGNPATTWTFLLDAEGHVLSLAKGYPLPPGPSLYWGGAGDGGHVVETPIIGMPQSNLTDSDEQE